MGACPTREYMVSAFERSYLGTLASSLLMEVIQSLYRLQAWFTLSGPQPDTGHGWVDRWMGG